MKCKIPKILDIQGKHCFSIYTYTHVQFEQLHKYIQNRNKIYKKRYTQKQSINIKLLGISRKQ